MPYDYEMLNAEEKAGLQAYLTHACGAFDESQIPEGGWPMLSEEQVLIDKKIKFVGHSEDLRGGSTDLPDTQEFEEFLKNDASIFYCDYLSKEGDIVRQYMSFDECNTSIGFHLVVRS